MCQGQDGPLVSRYPVIMRMRLLKGGKATRSVEVMPIRAYAKAANGTASDSLHIENLTVTPLQGVCDVM